MGLRVSVAMATYNGARFLPAQLASLADQTRLPDELVVVDDASTDDTREILDRFAEHAPFEVTLTPQPRNQGIAASFAAALARTQGDIVFLCDQDDHWYPSKVAEVLATFDAEPGLLLVVHDLDYADEHLTATGDTAMARLGRLGLSVDRFGHGCAMAVRGVVRDIALPIPDGRAHDVWLRRLVRHPDLVELLSTPLALYRIHGGNASTGMPLTEAVSGRNASLRSRWTSLAARLWPDVDHELAQERSLLALIEPRLVALIEVLSEEDAVSEPVRLLHEVAQADSEAIEDRLAVRARRGFVPRARAIRAATAGGLGPYQALPRPRVSMLRDALVGATAAQTSRR